MNILDLVIDFGYTVKRKASTYGGEFASACPFCSAGDDRFVIWPHRSNTNGSYQGGRYSCRKCGYWGDAVKFQMLINGLSYIDACKRIGVKCERQIRTKPIPPQHIETDFPPEGWMTKARAFANWSHQHLMRNIDAQMYLHQRGFTMDSMIKFKLGFNPGDKEGKDFFRERGEWGLPNMNKPDGSSRKLWLPVGYVIPVITQDQEVIRLKIRRSQWYMGEKIQKYVEVSGSMKGVSVFGNKHLPVGAVMESEFDALLVQQECQDQMYSIAMGGSTKPIDKEAFTLIDTTEKILYLPDFDEAGAKSMLNFRKKFPKCKCIPTPKHKSVGDFFAEGGNVRNWLSGELTESLKT